MSFTFDKNEEVSSNQDNFQEVSESTLKSSVSRSGLIRKSKSINSMRSQVDFCNIDQLPVRKVKLCREETKAALAEVSVRVQYILKILAKKFMVTITISRIKKNTLNKLLKCLRLLRTTLIMFTYFQIKNYCKTQTSPGFRARV